MVGMHAPDLRKVAPDLCSQTFYARHMCVMLHRMPVAMQAVVYATPRRDVSEISEDVRKAEVFINNR